jgi:hypothetical protein
MLDLIVSALTVKSSVFWGYNSTLSGGSRATFRRNISPISCCLLHPGFLFDLFFDREVGGDMSLQMSVDS